MQSVGVLRLRNPFASERICSAQDDTASPAALQFESGNQKLETVSLVSQEAFEGVYIAFREIQIFLGSRGVTLLNRIFGLGQVPFHAGLLRNHVAAKSEAGGALLLLQTIQTAIDRGGAVGHLVNLSLQFVEVSGIVCGWRGHSAVTRLSHGGAVAHSVVLR